MGRCFVGRGGGGWSTLGGRDYWQEARSQPGVGGGGVSVTKSLITAQRPTRGVRNKPSKNNERKKWRTVGSRGLGSLNGTGAASADTLPQQKRTLTHTHTHTHTLLSATCSSLIWLLSCGAFCYQSLIDNTAAGFNCLVKKIKTCIYVYFLL